MFLKLDGTFVIQLINFAIFFALLNVVFLRPVGSAIRERRQYINSLVAHNDLFREQAAELHANAEALRAAARREAEQILANSRAQTANETAEITQTYARRASTTIEEAQHTALAELDAARKDQQQNVRQLADLIVQQTVEAAT